MFRWLALRLLRDEFQSIRTRVRLWADYALLLERWNEERHGCAWRSQFDAWALRGGPNEARGVPVPAHESSQCPGHHVVVRTLGCPGA